MILHFSNNQMKEIMEKSKRKSLASRSSRPHENWNEIGNVRRKKVTKEPTINARDRRRDLKSIRHIKVTLAKLGVTDVDALIVEWEKIQQKLNAQKENDEKS